jgi:hypothetical protein
MADSIPVVQVVCTRIVKVDGELDEPQPEQPSIKIQILLRFAGDRRDVMDAEELLVQCALPVRSILPE